MRIVTWNCHGALRRKLAEADSLNADILVIQECEDPDHLKGALLEWAGIYLWAGESRHKGIGVFAKNGHRVSALDWQGTYQIPGLANLHPSTQWSTSELKLFLPFSINDSLTALGVWTKGSDQEAFGYVGQLWKYIQIHGHELSRKPAILIGDLNSNAIWDKPDRWWSHSGVVAELSQIGLHSLYHHAFEEPQGQESKPTFYLQKNLNKPYHIDYVFVSEDLLSTSQIEVGKQEDWLHASDHMPIIVTIESNTETLNTYNLIKPQ